MKSIGAHIYLTLVLLAGCSTKTGYVANWFGAKGYERADVTSKPIETLYWPEKVRYKLTEQESFFEVLINEKSYFVLRENISDDRRFYFLKTVAPLNLREAPNTKGKVLTVIKTGTVLPVVSVGKEIEVIDNRRGNWLETEVDGVKGWVYSGYVLVDNSIEKLQKTQESNLNLKYLAERKTRPEHLRKATKAKKVYENANYVAKIYVFEGVVSDELDMESQLIVEFKDKSKVLYMPNQARFNLQDKTSRIHKDMRVAWQTDCVRCCASAQDVFLVFGRDNVAYFTRYGLGFHATYCEAYDPDPRITMKLSQDGKAQYVQWEYEKCLDKNYKKSKPPQIHHSDFIRIDLSGDNAKYDYLNDSSVPSKYEAEWNSANEVAKFLPVEKSM